MWELAAIWAIVATAIVWFVRDERRVSRDRLDAMARLYATNPQWRHRGAPPRPAGLQPAPSTQTDIQRRFAEIQRRQLR